MSIQIDNTKEASTTGQWSNPGATLYDKLLDESNYKSLIKEAYLIAPVNRIKSGPEDERTSFSASGVSYPHHVIRGGKLVIHRRGLQASYSRAQQQGIFTGDVKAHIIRHYKELELYEESNIPEEKTAEHQDSTGDVDKFLQHYGILGMKWGIRRDIGPDGKVKTGTKETSPEHKQTRELRKKSISEMSNVELKTLTERMNLEQQYKRLSSEDISKGRKFVNKMVEQIGTEVVKEVVKGQVRKGLGLEKGKEKK